LALDTSEYHPQLLVINTCTRVKRVSWEEITRVGEDTRAARWRGASGKAIDPAYVRMLVKYDRLTPKRINSRLNLYPKSQVDNYVVEDRGTKAAQAAILKAGGPWPLRNSGTKNNAKKIESQKRSPV